MTCRSLLFKLLVCYGTRCEHRGKWWILSYLRKWLRADVDGNLEVVRNGINWILNPADFVHADIFWPGAKDRWDIYHLKQLLNSDCVLLDVGANIGFYSVYLASV